MRLTRRSGAAPTVWVALMLTLIMVSCFAMRRSLGQDRKVYQAGTIVEIKPHQEAQGTDTGKKGFDVSIKVGNKIYVVLYVPPGGQDFAEYGVGMDRTVLVEGDTMKLNDLLGRTRILPILNVKDAPAKTAN